MGIDIRRYMKFLVAFTGAMCVLGTHITDGQLSGLELVETFTGFLTAAGVGLIPNSTSEPAPPVDHSGHQH